MTGVGQRFSNLVLKKNGIELTKRAGDLTEEQEVSNLKYPNGSFTTILRILIVRIWNTWHKIWTWDQLPLTRPRGEEFRVDIWEGWRSELESRR